MSWPCRMIEYKKGQTLQIGDMFYGPSQEEALADEVKSIEEQIGLWWPHHFCRSEVLSDFYKQNNSHRKPLLVYLPGRILFCVDGACWRPGPDNHVEYYGGWKVSGEAPNITVEPSINCVGGYHGYIQNGTITDDCEGRKYGPDGQILRTK